MAAIDIPVILLMAVTLWKIKPITPFKNLNEDYLSIKSCNSLRGFFAVVVVFHHIAQRTSAGYFIRDFIDVGFLAVAVFFFFSGYGLQKKNLSDSAYSRGFLIKRLPAILIPYTIMGFIYWGMYIFLGEVRTISQVWTEFALYGNPLVAFSWYVISILVFYAVFYILMKIFKRHNLGMIIGGIAYYVLSIFVYRKISFGIWWYNASHLLVAGMIWATYEKQIFNFLKKSFYIFIPCVWILFVILFKKQYTIQYYINNEWAPLITSLIITTLFVAGVVLFSLKFKVGNKILDFLGSMSFEIYMVQGLFIHILRTDFIYIENDALWSAASLAGTIVTSYLLHKLFGFIMSKYKLLTDKIL